MQWQCHCAPADAGTSGPGSAWGVREQSPQTQQLSFQQRGRNLTCLRLQITFRGKMWLR